MLKSIAPATLVFLLLTACASGPEPYRAAKDDRANGYSSIAIESNRHRISYRAEDIVTAQNYALLRAAEITREHGDDWFRVVNAYTQQADPYRSGGNTSVSVGGSTGSYGSGIGIGLGIGLGGGDNNDTIHVLEILTGSGERPVGEEVYDAYSVMSSLGGAALGPH
ncbi:MAG: hypothetical protein MRY64_10470 [Hyphomonadaceae bacterium]|nr:hypothetical protein [Hyphomonadaceae bacterium]